MTKDEIIDEIVGRCKEVMENKGDAYSMQIDGLGRVDDIMLSGLDVVLNRIISKSVRLNNQLKGREVSFQGYDKKPDDDFIDLINHCFIGLMLRQGLWYAGWEENEHKLVPLDENPTTYCSRPSCIDSCRSGWVLEKAGWKPEWIS